MIGGLLSRLVVMIVVSMPLAGAWAQSGWQVDPMGPRLARGLSTQYGTFSAENIDTINNFNGSVNLSIPIGQSYPAGGALSYQLLAHYSSNDFDIRESLLQEGPPGSQPVPYSVRVPNALSNAGRGWSLHLGRLFEAGDGAANEQLPQIEREKRPIVTEVVPAANKAWLYAAPDGSTHQFYSSLNAESTTTPGVYYTRDGSYLRLKEHAPGSITCPAPAGSQILACATLEFPSGIVHFFERKLLWGDSSFNKDKWRLRRIYDRSGSNGAENNTILIKYSQNHWEIDDKYDNAVRPPIKIYWQADHNGNPAQSWYYGRVEKVVLPKFGGGTAEYNFSYVQKPFQRLNEDGTNFETRYAGYLIGISRPDGASYSLTETVSLLNPIRTMRAGLPTGGSIEWRFDNINLPYEGLCQGGSSAGPAQTYVDQRVVRDVDGNTLTETLYLRNVNYSALVPTDYCPPYNGEPEKRVESELIVGEFQKYTSGKGRLTLRYFSIFPLWGDNLGNGTAGGWTSLEFGQPFTRDEKRVGHNNRDLFLSTRIFDCPFSSVQPYQPNGIRTDVESLASTCTQLRSTYVAYDGLASAPACPINEGCVFFLFEYTLRNAMLKESQTVYHDDNASNVKTTSELYSENDGFGHFRTHRMTGNISARDTRETRTFYNAGNGELKLTASGGVAAGSSWRNKSSSEPWILGMYTHSKLVDAGGRVYRQQTCFDADTGLLNQVRIRKNSDNDTAADADHENDILRRYVYTDGLPTKVSIYGGDTQTLNPNGCTQAAIATAPFQSISRTFEYGALKMERIVGASTTTVDDTIDAATGMSAKSRDGRGINEDVYSYDAIGRPISVVRNNGRADTFVSYLLPAYSTPSPYDDHCDRTIQLPFPPQTISFSLPRIDMITKEGAKVFSHMKSCANDLGQVLESYAPHPESGEMKVVSKYGPDGAVTSQTVPQLTSDFSPSAKNELVYDALGRVVKSTSPDGTFTTTGYKGIREVSATVKVGTSESGSAVTQTDSVTRTTLDRFGNPLSVTTPGHTTTALFDGLDRATRIARGTQSRVYRYDGRGFLEWEYLPELGTKGVVATGGYKTYGKYDALGNVLESFDGVSSYYNTYDAEGRLVEVRANTGDIVPLVKYVYGDATAGNGNGRIISAVRHSIVSPTTGMFSSLRSAIHEVDYGYVFTPAGAVSQRTISIRGWTDGSHSNPLQAGIQFTQSWTYDALGRVDTGFYPLCSTGACTDAPRAYGRTYAAGGALVSVSSFDQFAGPMGADFNYGPTGRLNAIHHRNGRTDWIGIDPNRMPRPGSYKLAGVRSDQNAPGLLNLGGFSYDALGNILKIGNVKHVYDPNARLVKAYNPSLANPGTGDFRSYAYDQYDNFTLKDSQPQSYDPNTNRHNDPGVLYDKSGRVVQVGTRYTLEYSIDGRQLTYIDNPTQVASPCRPYNYGQSARCFVNLYGPDGERVGVISNNLGLGRNLIYQWYLRDLDGEVLRTYEQTAESDSTASDPIRRKDFLYAGRTLIATYSPGVSEQHRRIRYFHNDHLDTTRLATDALGMPIAAPRHYWPYGDDASSDFLSEWVSEWAGYEEDGNGLTHNLKNRTYFKGWGRFLTPDPARAGWNLYAYANNNPIGFIDPAGLEAQCTERGVESNGEEAKEIAIECGKKEEKIRRSATEKCGSGCAGSITVKGNTASIHLRSYAPYRTFGGGFVGNNRGPSTSLDPRVTSKAHVEVVVDPSSGRVCGCFVYENAARHRFFDYGGITAHGLPRARVTQKDGNIFVDMEANNPRVIGSADIDINAKLTIQDGAIHWYVSGDGFPNAEMFVVGLAGTATMLDHFETNAWSLTGPYSRLPGHGTVPMMIGSAPFP
jgi:RHS repeat-associated protein